MASLGGLIFLEALDMTGCRGAPDETERMVWQAIESRRDALAVPLAELRALRATAERLVQRADENPQDRDDLRRQAAKIRETFERLIGTGG